MARPFALTFGGWREGDDPLLIAEEIDIAEVRLRRFAVPLEEARFTIARDVEQRFLTETDPEGKKWKPWSDNYKKRGERENISILRKKKGYHQHEDEPQLFDAATDPNSYIVHSHSVSSGAYSGGDVALIGEALPDYWIYHQEGTSNMSARPFEGVSDEAELAIYEIFDTHVEGSLAGMVRRTGQPIIRTPRGPRFASHFLHR